MSYCSDNTLRPRAECPNKEYTTNAQNTYTNNRKEENIRPVKSRILKVKFLKIWEKKNRASRLNQLATVIKIAMAELG